MSRESLNLQLEKTLGYRAFRRLIAFIWFVMFRPRIIGMENIPDSGPVLIAPIHRSNIDFAFVIFATKRKTFFMAKDSLFRVPVLGVLIRTMGAFPVRRGTADRDSLNNAQEVLRQGQPLVLFPEGTRQEGDSVGPLLDGAMFVASRLNVPVVPVGLGNTEKAMPKGAKFPKPVRTTMVVGQQIMPPTSDGKVSRSEIAAATLQLQAGLQQVYDEARNLLR